MNRLLTLGLSSRPSLSPTRKRLTQAFGRLEQIKFGREAQMDPGFAKAAGERIVWRELLDLELQDIDEQIERISSVAGESIPLA